MWWSFGSRVTSLNANSNSRASKGWKAETEDFSRYPTVECLDEVRADQEFTVQVSLTKELVTPGVEVEKGGAPKLPGAARMVLPRKRDVPEYDAWNIDAVLYAPDFRLLDAADHAVLTLPREGDSDVVAFRLRPKPGRAAARPSKLFVTFWHHGTFLAKVARSVTVLDDAQQNTPPPAGDHERRAAEEEVNLKELYNTEKPDLTLYVQSRGGRAGEGSVIVDSPYLQLSSTPFDVPEGTRDWIDAQYKSFAGVKPRDPEAEGVAPAPAARARLRGFGAKLYRQYAPPAFKEAFWALLNDKTINFRTIQIYTDDPTIPWELMRPVSDDGRVEREFLGLEFSVGRWHISDASASTRRPPNLLVLHELVAVAPEYQGAQALPAQAEELQSLASFPHSRRMPGNMAALRELLAHMPQGIIHFAGHGAVGAAGRNVSEFVIKLEDGTLDPLAWSGMVGERGYAHPLVFFNACEVGQAERVANFVNGWAPAVLETGASGYIGALWPLSDRGASKFAALFYRTLGRSRAAEPASVAEALMLTRREYLKNGDPTFLAYVYYGDPNLEVVPY